jgi:predicted transposase YbfD/YdcC
MSSGFAQSPQSQTPRPSILPAAALTQRLQDCFATIVDPRVERTRLHLLSDILTIAILSVIAGGTGWEDMELYGESKQPWLSTFLSLPNGIPSADTFRRVLERIHPQQFEQCFQRWVHQLVGELGIQVIAIDGKTAKGSYDREAGCRALHLVSAWTSEHRLVLAQAKVQDKSNEITAIPALLELLDIKGCIVTLDAMGTQKSIAQQIHSAGADYILSLKANHPTLYQQVQQEFQTAQAADRLPPLTEHTTESGHHRIEIRKVWSLPLHSFPALHQAQEWSGLQTIVAVERIRQLWNKTTHEIQFYLSSLPPESPRIAAAIRQHWGIENTLHWTLDVTFAEDDCRIRSLHAPQNMALLRRFALNSLNREATGKQSLRQKSKRAAMDDLFMLRVLTAALPDPFENSNSSCQ